jgi:Leucine-rich repeat (LRR) protein
MGTLDKIQRKHLSAIRKQIAQKTWEEVAQGVALAASIGDPAVMAALTEGLTLDAGGRLDVGAGELQRRVKSALRSDAALALALASGMLDGVARLDLGALAGLSRLELLQGMPSLESLRLSGLVLPDLGPLADVPGLTHLDLSIDPSAKLIPGCLQRLPTLAGVTQLTRLEVRNCGLRDLSLLRGMTALVELDVSQTVLMKRLEGLASDRLEHLNLRGNTGLVDLGGLEVASGLRTLNLRDCSRLTGLGPLAGLTGLTHLELWGAYSLEDLGPLSGLVNLEVLTLRSALALVELAPLAGLTRLRDLDLAVAHKVRDIEPLAGLVNLERLLLYGCPELRTLAPLAGLTRLTELQLSGLTGADLTPLAGLRDLRRLSLQAMKGTLDLTPLAGLDALETLNLFGCESVVGLEALEGVEVGP